MEQEERDTGSEGGPAYEEELAGNGGDELTDREEGGPTSPAEEPEEDVTGGGPSKSPGSDFEPH